MTEQGPVVLATVGDKEITAGYYEGRLAKLEKSELPRDEDGRPLDTAAWPGKQEFLKTLINKEVMGQKAEPAGLRPGSPGRRRPQSLLAYEAGVAMWAEVVERAGQHDQRRGTGRLLRQAWDRRASAAT